VAVHEVPFDSDRWRWSGARPTPAQHLGCACVPLGTTTGTLADVDLVDGTVELDLVVGPERGFHGVTWRGRDDENYESFFVRPHRRSAPRAQRRRRSSSASATVRCRSRRPSGLSRRRHVPLA
jgi:hypothetical protein